MINLRKVQNYFIAEPNFPRWSPPSICALTFEKVSEIMILFFKIESLQNAAYVTWLIFAKFDTLKDSYSTAH